jgi:hypothetical protein
MPVLLDACGSSHPDLRQCAVYSMGLGASLAPEAFKPHAPAAMAALQAILTAPVSHVTMLGAVVMTDPVVRRASAQMADVLPVAPTTCVAVAPAGLQV